MCKLFERFKRDFLNIKFLKFSLFGVINTFNTSWISSLLHTFLQENIAAGIAFLISLSFAYCLNSKFTFKFPLSKRGYFLFLLTYVPNFIIYFLVTFFTISTLNLPQFWGTALATMICGPITFILMKFFTFNNKFNNKDSRK